MIWVTHVIAYFCHEYSHSFVAWLFGYKSNPFAIEYGRFNIRNVLLQTQVDEDVSYRTILAQGQGHIAALIAFAGMGFGNGSLYLFSRRLLRKKKVRIHVPLFLFSFWLCFMNVANFYDYIPVRTFTTHGDIAYLSQGLNISPWLILIVLGYPTAWALWHLFARVLPDTFQFLPHGSRVQRTILVVICAFIMFDYFGAAGLFGFGDVSGTLSGISMLSFPMVVAICWPVRKSGFLTTHGEMDFGHQIGN
jgi:hypothetical protein